MPMALHENVIGELNRRILMRNTESDDAKQPADTRKVLTASTRPSRLCCSRYRDLCLERPASHTTHGKTRRVTRSASVAT